MKIKNKKKSLNIDKNMTFSFGALVLIFMLTATSITFLLLKQSQIKEENRLLNSLAFTLSESISRISFSGKYQMRLLVEDMANAIPGVEYISVENAENIVIANSNSIFNDKSITKEEIEKNRKCIEREETLIEKRKYKNDMVNEVIIPFRSGFDNEVQGVIKLGVNLRESQAKQKLIFFKLSILIALLTLITMQLVYYLSKYYAKSVVQMASQLDGIMRNSDFSIIVTDNFGKILSQSKETLKIFGIDLIEDNLGDLLKSVFNDWQIEYIYNLNNEVFKNGISKDFDINVDINDEKRYWLVSIFPVMKNKLGETIQICTTIHDVTERKREQFALLEKEETFRRIFDNSADGIMLIKDELIVECNNSTLKYFGISAKEELLNKNLLEFAPDNQADNRTSIAVLHENYDNAIKKGYSRFDWIYKKPNMGIFYADITITTISISGETVLHISWRDITDRIKNDREKETLQQQLYQSQKMESIGRLAGGVAHDFNNMLSVIIGFSELTVNKFKDNPILTQNLSEILKAAHRSSELTKQLLVFARKQEVNPTDVDLNVTINGLLSMLHRLLGEDIDLGWYPGKDLWHLKIDTTQLDQIVVNLCVNSKDAIDGKGKITIETSNVLLDDNYCKKHANFYPGEYVLLSVSDNGCGMDEETKKHIFEPFYTTKDTGRGTGLGLSTVYGIVQQNNGLITLYSEKGTGTTFNIYIPKSDEFIIPLQEKEIEVEMSEAHESILVVEDEVAVMSFVKSALEELGYTVYANSNPLEAIEFFKSGLNIDLLLTDVIMPEMNGRDLSEELLKIQPTLKVLYMSGYTANVIGRHGVLDNQVDFIHKPFTIEDISKKIRRVLNS